jgi:hypothetical protein
MITTVYRIYMFLLLPWYFVLLSRSFYFVQSPSRKREYLQNTTVQRSIMCYSFVVMCFLIQKKKILKNSRVREYSPEYPREVSARRLFSEFYKFTSLILSPYIVMGSFCLAINSDVSLSINRLLKPSLGGKYDFNTVFRWPSLRRWSNSNWVGNISRESSVHFGSQWKILFTKPV